MQFDFIKDLDNYFCEAYANYDSICLLPGYVMPKMQEMKKDEFGDYIAYTLPASTMRLALQEKKEEILKAFKEKLKDRDFSFTFSVPTVSARFKSLVAKDAPHRVLKKMLSKKRVKSADAQKMLEIDGKIWKKILRGDYWPTKNLIFSLAITQNMEYADVKEMLASVEEGFDYEKARDAVLAYLLLKKITSPDMQKAALDEYHIDYLFVKWPEQA